MDKQVLITSALPYVNNVPHLGNIIGCVLSADVFARYNRSIGRKTLYICATDEYGTATETKAREENLTVEEICNKYHKIHKLVYEHFNIQFDFFGRTSFEEHTEITQKIFKDLEENQLILEQESEQTFCENDQIFLADRYVEGVCPFCSYEDARGDQCDQCGKLLQPMELINPKCKLCGKTPGTKRTKHLYLDLPKIEEKLRSFQRKSIKLGHWAKNSISVTQGWMDIGLQSRPITRDLNWGVSVPKKGYEKKVFYVWFDAPIGYISNTKKGFPDTWKNWWCEPERNNLYQFMAKDNIPFHTVIFPATLIGTSDDWTLLHHINSTEYLNYENTKFSKSRNIGVFGTDVMNSEIHIDLWRFYLLYNRPEKSDSNFSWSQFVEDVNNNFINNIGNLINRVLVFTNRNFNSEIGPVNFKKDHQFFLEKVDRVEKEILELFETVSIKDALKKILSLGKMGNNYFQSSSPWVSIKSDPCETKCILKLLLYLIRDLASLLFPFMPDTSEKIFDFLNSKDRNLTQLGSWDQEEIIRVKPSKILFKKIDPSLVPKMKEKFSGNSMEQIEKTWNKIQIKVGKVESVSQHSNADRLYVEEINCGEANNRIIVSGVKSFISKKELLGKKVLVITNLKHSMIRGVLSQGMLLTVENQGQQEILFADNAEVGVVLKLQGKKYNFINKEIPINWLKENVTNVIDGVVSFQGSPLELNGEVVKTTNILNGIIR